ncbi:hypothetical protein OH77DRAFT_1259238 [Trametes cingulata]|nr:hypothetical protein OH77DRAFT_1259238 [Trametes cingulata]
MPRRHGRAPTVSIEPPRVPLACASGRPGIGRAGRGLAPARSRSSLASCVVLPLPRPPRNARSGAPAPRNVHHYTLRPRSRSNPVSLFQVQALASSPHHLLLHALRILVRTAYYNTSFARYRYRYRFTFHVFRSLLPIPLFVHNNCCSSRHPVSNSNSVSISNDKCNRTTRVCFASIARALDRYLDLWLLRNGLRFRGVHVYSVPHGPRAGVVRYSS